MTATIPPLKPFSAGKIDGKFGGPADSAREVLERARIALSPRGAWKHGDFTGQSHEGHSRCLIQTFRDVDGIHVSEASKILIKAAKEVTGITYTSVEKFNDAKSTKKHHVIMALDLAIAMA